MSLQVPGCSSWGCSLLVMLLAPPVVLLLHVMLPQQMWPLCLPTPYTALTHWGSLEL
jgi:hypothetical protein